MKIENPLIQYYDIDDTIIATRSWHDDNGIIHREDGPAEIKYSFDGDVESERWCKHGNIHRLDGPAVISYYSDGSLKYEAWYKDGKEHRDLPDPSTVEYELNGIVTVKGWNTNDLPHNTNGLPASIMYYEDTGKVNGEYWYRHGEDYRENGLPDAVEYDENGLVIKEEWFKNSGHHRKDGPALIRYMDGKKYMEEWHQHDEWHRLDGPALIEYDDNGKISESSWYLNGHRIDIKELEKYVKLPKEDKVLIKLVFGK